MPLRRSNAWFNHPGVALAVQPAGAPDPGMARTNLAPQSGVEVYNAVAPGWSAQKGWIFSGSQYLRTTFIPAGYNGVSAYCSGFVRYTNGTAGYAFAVSGPNPWPTFGFRTPTAPNRRYENHGTLNINGVGTGSGVGAISGGLAFYNGVQEGTITFAHYAAIAIPVFIGALNNAGSAAIWFYGEIQALAFFSYPVSVATVRIISREMAGCTVRPEWNAWVPTHRWFNTESRGISGGVVARAQLVKSGAATSAAVVSKATTTTRTGSLTPAGSVLRRAARALSGTVTSGATLLKRAARAISGALTPTASLLGKALKVLGGTLASAGAYIATHIPLSGTLFYQAAAGALTSAGALLKQGKRALSGALPSIGTTAKRPSSNRAGSAAPSGQLSKKPALSFSGVFTPAATLVRRIQKVLAGSVAGSAVLEALAGAVEVVKVFTLIFRSRILNLPPRTPDLDLTTRTDDLTLPEDDR